MKYVWLAVVVMMAVDVMALLVFRGGCNQDGDIVEMLRKKGGL